MYDAVFGRQIGKVEFVRVALECGNVPKDVETLDIQILSDIVAKTMICSSITLTYNSRYLNCVAPDMQYTSTIIMILGTVNVLRELVS